MNAATTPRVRMPVQSHGKAAITAVVVGVAVATAALVGLHLARGLGYWNYSEGVYAYLSRLLLRGQHLYGHVVVPQPPWTILIGAVILSLHDGMEWLRWAVGALQLVGGALAAVAVWRLTHSRIAAALACPLMLLTPWAVHEHGSLTPELVAVPLVVGCPILLARPRTVPAGAVLAASLPFVKWPYVLAAVAMVALSAEPRRAARWAVGALVLQAAVFGVVFGPGLWHDSVVAQLHVGSRGLGLLKGVWGQAFWNLIGLVVAAAAALAWRSRLAELRLLRILAGGAAGLLLTLASNTKVGTGLNIIVPMEAALIPLAVSGVVAAGRASGARARWAQWGAAAAALGIAFTLSQSASLLASPRTETPFLYVSSERGSWGRLVSSDGVERLAMRLRRCPPGAAYGGPPYLAFIASRPMPDQQPDQFLTTHSSTLRSVAARMASVRPVCG